MIEIKHTTQIAALLTAFALLGASICLSKAAEEEQTKVELTKVPKLECGPGGTGELKGKVTGLKSYKGLHIVLYAYCDGIYYVQPTIANAATDIDESDGTFDADVHGGQHYVALLVKEGFKAQSQLQQLPKAGGNVVAVSSKKRPQ